MRRLLRILAQVLFLIIVALASTLVSMRFAIHGREVAVPDFRGMAPAQAEQAALDRGLELTWSERFYSATVAAGRIVSQQPDPGTRVRHGWSVQVARSLGPQLIDVPALVGMSPRAAEIDIRRRGLQVGSFAQLPASSPSSSSSDEQTVLAQSPAAGAQGIASPRIGLLYSAPAPESAYVMPDLRGLTVAQAGHLVSVAGLKISSVSFAPIPVASETAGAAVAGQTPATAEASGQSSAPSPSTSPNPVQSSAGATIVAQSPSPGSRVTSATGLTLQVTRPL